MAEDIDLWALGFCTFGIFTICLICALIFVLII